MSSVFSKLRAVALLSCLTASTYGMCASYDYSAYKVHDDDFVIYKARTLQVSHFIKDLEQRNDAKENIVAIKSSGSFILDTGFSRLVAVLADSKFLPSLEVLDVSFNRIDGSFLEDEGAILAVQNLLKRDNFVLDVTGNNLASSPTIGSFFSALKDPSLFQKIIWIHDSHLDGMAWINDLKNVGLRPKELSSLMRSIMNRHKTYFEKNISYDNRFSLKIDLSEEEPASKDAIKDWNTFIDRIDNLDLSIETLKEGARLIQGEQGFQKLDLDGNRLALGKRLCSLQMNGDNQEKAFKIFFTLAIDERVFPSIRGEAYYYLSEIHKRLGNAEESRECSDQAFLLGCRKGW